MDRWKRGVDGKWINVVELCNTHFSVQRAWRWAKIHTISNATHQDKQKNFSVETHVWENNYTL